VISPTIAVTRDPGAELARCELTHLVRASIDIERAREQHLAYCRALAALGCEVHSLGTASGFPDAVFVEDTAVVVDELAVIARPGTPTRRGEVDAVARHLEAYRPLARIVAPATLDGGDVLRIGRTLYVGLGSRTNRAGIAQLAALLEPLGYGVVPVPVSSCLHLKSAVTTIGDELLLLNPQWVDPSALGAREHLPVDPDEPFAANALRVAGTLIYPIEHRRTLARLEAAGLEVMGVETSELAKAEGAVTCCSILLERIGAPADDGRCDPAPGG
jgi:dimethylargininase